MININKKLRRLQAIIDAAPDTNEGLVAKSKLESLESLFGVKLKDEAKYVSKIIKVRDQDELEDIILYPVLTRHFRVQMLIQMVQTSKGLKEQIVLFGEEKDVEFAENIYFYLFEVLTIKWNFYRQQYYDKTDYVKKSFYVGIFQGIEEQYKRFASQYGIVPSNTDLKEAFETQFKLSKDKATNHSVAERHRMDGKRQGEKINLKVS